MNGSDEVLVPVVAECSACRLAGPRAEEDRIRGEERHRIAWWLRQVATGPVSVHATADYLEAVTDLADVIANHPGRFADAPAHPRGDARA